MSENKGYKFISLEFLEDMAGGDDEFLVEMIDTYLASIPNSLDKLKQAYEQGDNKQLLLYAHKLKGSFNFIGCTQVGSVLSEVEEYAQNLKTNINLPEQLKYIFDDSSKITAELESLRKEKLL